MGNGAEKMGKKLCVFYKISVFVSSNAFPRFKEQYSN